MDVLEMITPPPVRAMDNTSCLILDCNAPQHTMELAISSFGDSRHNLNTLKKTVVLEPTSVAKAAKVAREGLLVCVHVMTPNRDELLAMASALNINTERR